MKIGELFFNLGFNADTMKLKDFTKAISELNMSSILSAGSFGALYEGAKQLIDLTHTLGDSVNKFSIITGVSRGELQRWSRVAHDVGASGGMAEDSLTKIREQMDKIAHGQPMNLFFGRLGLREVLGTEKDPAVIYKKLLENLKLLDDSTARTYLAGAGLNNENLLLSKRNDLEKLYRDQVIQSDDELDNVAKNLLKLNEASDKIQTIFAKLGDHLLPGINIALDEMNKKLGQMAESRLLKDILWLTENLVMGAGKDVTMVGGGLEKLYRYMIPWWDKDSAFNANSSMGNIGYGLGHLNNPLDESRPITQNNTIIVNGDPDPNKTANLVNEKIRDHIKHTLFSGSGTGF